MTVMDKPSFARLEIKRRRVIQAAAVLTALIASGCASPTLLSGALTDLENMINDFVNEASSLGSIVGLSSTTITMIQGWISQLETYLQTITGITSTVTSTQLTTVQQALQTIENILGALEPFGNALPAPFDEIIPAIYTLLPFVADIFGVTITISSGATLNQLALRPHPHIASKASGMSITSAEAIVAQYAKTGGLL